MSVHSEQADPRQAPRRAPSQHAGQRWLLDAKARATVAIVVTELGLRWTRQDRRLEECPSCHATKPARSNRSRGAVRVWTAEQRWWCSVCEVRGDALDLVCLVQWGKRFEAGDPSLSSQLRSWCAARGFCQSAEGERVERVTLRTAPKVRERPPVSPAEVANLWHQARQVLEDEAVTAWLRSRGVDPWLAEDRGLARALPDQAPPGWAKRWPELGARCLLPVWGEDGSLVSLQARVVQPSGPKALAPPGHNRTRTGVLADGTARALLRGEGWPEVAGCQAVIVTEGDVDYLLRACWVGEVESAPAVFGVLGADAWPRWLAGRIPAGWTVYVDVHRDEAGERLLDQVVADLGTRCPIVRVAP
jgi:hypothetical protein